MFESHLNTANAAAFPRLLGDIGGTNARLGWQAGEGAEIEQVHVLACSEHASLTGAIEAYLKLTGLPRPACAALGMALPVSGDVVSMTNHHWRFSISAVREQLGLLRLLVLNDFTALALALPHLPTSSLVQIGPLCEPAQHATIGLIGPGTGLGVSGLVPVPGSGRWLPLAGEGGHVSLSASTAEEFAVVEQLQRRYGHASAERAVSGAGLLDLYQLLSQIRGGQSMVLRTPAQVLEQAMLEPAGLASDALEMFCGFLGSVAGNLALTLGARGGIYIGGGIVPRFKERFAQSSFRARFEAKGRYSSYLQDIPTWLIDAPASPALLGASLALEL
ncbi:MAG: glucokinase [Betaproteobacteria bacterium]